MTASQTVKAGLVTIIVPSFDSGSTARAWAAGCTTDRLKMLWDTAEDWNPGLGSFLVEAIHYEMNRRGEGRYVAV